MAGLAAGKKPIPRRYQTWTPKLGAQARHRKNFEIVYRHLLANPCKCGVYDVRVLQFHHLNGKEFNVSSELWNASTERIKREIAKCDVVCANCHRKEHSNRLLTAVKYGLLDASAIARHCEHESNTSLEASSREQ